jgi:hypothetical protein
VKKDQSICTCIRAYLCMPTLPLPAQKSFHHFSFPWLLYAAVEVCIRDNTSMDILSVPPVLSKLYQESSHLFLGPPQSEVSAECSSTRIADQQAKLVASTILASQRSVDHCGHAFIPVRSWVLIRALDHFLELVVPTSHHNKLSSCLLSNSWSTTRTKSARPIS